MTAAGMYWTHTGSNGSGHVVAARPPTVAQPTPYAANTDKSGPCRPSPPCRPPQLHRACLTLRPTVHMTFSPTDLVARQYTTRPIPHLSPAPGGRRGGSHPGTALTLAPMPSPSLVITEIIFHNVCGRCGEVWMRWSVRSGHHGQALRGTTSLPIHFIPIIPPLPGLALYCLAVPRPGLPPAFMPGAKA